MKYRVDDLAARAAVSVDTVRYYQAKGLLPPPERDGRISWYSDDHLRRLERIRALKSTGFTLASIARLLSGEHPADEALVSAVVSSDEGLSGTSEMSLEELSQRTGVSPALLEAIEREGLLAPRDVGGAKRYSTDDADAVQAGLALLEAGLPLGELLALARTHDAAMRDVAAEAVDLFARFVRDPIRAQTASESEAAERLVAAFRTMLPAVTSLVARHFRRVLLDVARERIEGELEDVT
ncbi:MAG TPA: MerR family transcriptional regulator [Actinomycetota bacterium]|nr:MerR family transcriptional regulator [Actinomycetota bacterium]